MSRGAEYVSGGGRPRGPHRRVACESLVQEGAWGQGEWSGGRLFSRSWTGGFDDCAWKVLAWAWPNRPHPWVQVPVHPGQD